MMLPRFFRYAAQRLRRLDFSLLTLCGALLFAGVLFVYGTGQHTGGRFASFWMKQLIWIALGGIAFGVTVLVDYRWLGKWSWLFYLGSVVLLILVLGMGREIHGARSWLVIPGGTLQPSELGKPATLLALAWVGSRPTRWFGRLKLAVGVLVLAGVPMFLIALQPDYGTALVYLPVALVIVFLGGISYKWLLAAGIAVLLMAPVGYGSLAEHQKERIQTFVHPSDDISDAGWNAHQSLLAVGSGGLWGKGYMKGTQHVLGFLPRTVAPTDFVFSVVAEETGFVGAGAMVCAFFGILVCCLRAAVLAPDRFGMFLASGAAVLFFVHTYVNIGMTIRAAPIIGIPLPFVSYGGSFMLCTMITVGLVQNVYIGRNAE